MDVSAITNFIDGGGNVLIAASSNIGGFVCLVCREENFVRLVVMYTIMNMKSPFFSLFS